MDFYALVATAGISFLFLVLVFRPLEMAFPAKAGQGFFRPAWWTDLSFFLGQYLLWNGLVLWMLSWLNQFLGGVVPESFRHMVAAQPWWLQAVEVILLSDFSIYWGHRLQHRVGFLWRFHAVHHSAERLDWLVAHREHPLHPPRSRLTAAFHRVCFERRSASRSRRHVGRAEELERSIVARPSHRPRRVGPTRFSMPSAKRPGPEGSTMDPLPRRPQPARPARRPTRPGRRRPATRCPRGCAAGYEASDPGRSG